MKNWNPASYDSWYKTPLGKTSHRLEKDLIFSLLDVKKGEKALDLGSGTGIYSIELAKKGSDVSAVDSSQDMLGFAKARSMKQKHNITFIRAYAKRLPFKNASFDLIVSVCSLCFVKNPQRALKEAARVLKPDGRFVAAVLNKNSPWAVIRRAKGLFRETIYSQARFMSPAELEKLLADAGFRVIDVKTCLFFPPIDSRPYLKKAIVFEKLGKTALKNTGAFVAASAVKRPTE
ncbi:MAG: class I SAM-dependent methyltransferase [Deltaproteobacteria bacterium]|nr:class I SAM-dependent methyltransferase [Deltaproteobacteria bacterium]